MQILLFILLAMAALTGGYVARTRSLLGALNFGVFQWFGFRLVCGWSTRHYPAGPTPGRWWSPTAPPRGVAVIWSLYGWMWPLTGWWTEYRFISSRLHVVNLRWPDPPAATG